MRVLQDICLFHGYDCLLKVILFETAQNNLLLIGDNKVVEL